MRNHFSRIPMTLGVVCTVFFLVPLWSAAFLGSPTTVLASHSWSEIAILAPAYWILPVVIALCILQRSYVLLPAFLMECAFLAVHCVQNAGHLGTGLVVIRLLIVLAMSVLGLLIISKDTLYPFFSGTDRFWRKVTRLYSKYKLNLVQEDGTRISVNLQDCSLTGIGISVEEETPRSLLAQFPVGQHVQLELNSTTLVSAELVWTREVDSVRYAGFAVADQAAMENLIRELPLPTEGSRFFHWWNKNWATTSFRRSAVLAWVLTLAGVVGIPSCSKKSGAAISTDNSSFSSLVGDTNSALNLYLTSNQLNLSSDAAEQLSFYSGASLQGKATQIEMGDKYTVLHLDTTTVTLVPADPSDESAALAERGNTELQKLLEGIAFLTVVFDNSEGGLVTPAILREEPTPVLPFFVSFQIDAFLTVEGEGTSPANRSLVSARVDGGSKRKGALATLGNTQAGKGVCGKFAPCTGYGCQGSCDSSYNGKTCPTPKGSVPVVCCATGFGDVGMGYAWMPASQCHLPCEQGGDFCSGPKKCCKSDNSCHFWYSGSGGTGTDCKECPDATPIFNKTTGECEALQCAAGQTKCKYTCCGDNMSCTADGRGCQCGGGTLLSGNGCACPAGKYFNSGRCYSCPPTMVPNNVQTGCTCPRDAAGVELTLVNVPGTLPSCICPPPQTLENGICQFKKADCSSSPSKPPPGQTNVACSVFPATDDAAPPFTWCCSPGQTCGGTKADGTRDPSSDGACFDCPPGKTKVNGVCRCPSNQAPDPLQGGACGCPQTNSQLVGGTCYCKPNTVADPVNGGCKPCDDPSQVVLGGVCTCPASAPVFKNGVCKTCPPNSQWDAQKKGCFCLPGMIGNGVTSDGGCMLCAPPNIQDASGVCKPPPNLPTSCAPIGQSPNGSTCCEGGVVVNGICTAFTPAPPPTVSCTPEGSSLTGGSTCCGGLLVINGKCQKASEGTQCAIMGTPCTDGMSCCTHQCDPETHQCQ